MTSLNIFTKCPYTGNPKSRLRNFLTTKERVFITKYMILNILKEVAEIKGIYINLWVYPTYKHKFFINISSRYNINLLKQTGNSLFERMQNCIISESKSFKKIILIGSDIPSITNKCIEEAIACLDKKNYVVGPSKDGGFYLLGIKNFNRNRINLLEHKNGNCSSITKFLDEKIISYNVLMKLKDIDTKADLLSF